MMIAATCSNYLSARMGTTCGGLIHTLINSLRVIRSRMSRGAHNLPQESYIQWRSTGFPSQPSFRGPRRKRRCSAFDMQSDRFTLNQKNTSLGGTKDVFFYSAFINNWAVYAKWTLICHSEKRSDEESLFLPNISLISVKRDSSLRSERHEYNLHTSLMFSCAPSCNSIKHL